MVLQVTPLEVGGVGMRWEGSSVIPPLYRLEELLTLSWTWGT